MHPPFIVLLIIFIVLSDLVMEQRPAYSGKLCVMAVVGSNIIYNSKIVYLIFYI